MLVGTSGVLSCGDTVVDAAMDGSSDATSSDARSTDTTSSDATSTSGPIDDEIPVTIASIELAFHRSHDGDFQIRGKRADDDATELIAHAAPDERLWVAGWSFDGAFLAVSRTARDPEASDSDILVFGVDSIEPHVIAGGNAPRFSTMRRELAFARPTGADAETSELMLFDLDTGSERRVGAGSAAPCSWSPEGDRLAVRGAWTEPGASRGIYVVDVATGEATRVESTGPDAVDLGQQGCMEWSPQDEVFAFESNALDLSVWSAVHVVNVDGSGLRVLPGSGYGVGDISWLPTGDAIVAPSWGVDSVYSSDYFVEQIELDGRAFSLAGSASEYAERSDGRVAVVEYTTHAYDSVRRIRVGEWFSAPEAADWSDGNVAWRPVID